MSRNAKPASITVTGSFDEIIVLLKAIPKHHEIMLKVTFLVRDPETDRLVSYELPVMNADKGTAAQRTVDGLFRQARLTEKEYNEVRDKLVKIKKLMGV